ncbi:MAG: hypothetical protein ABIK79_02735 [Chloroflexota bacterium]|nr:hypothetical protein [Anaerolineae bacterium]
MTGATTGDIWREIVDQVLRSSGSTFLQGPAGSGKTTLAVQRVLALLDGSVPAEAILILLPQRTLAAPYLNALRSPKVGPSGEVTVVTVDGLARRTIALFWPLIAERAGFSHPEQPPSFLTLETAQYYMSRILEPLRGRGYFAGISIRPTRLVGQILDNLNKAAIVGFPFTEIAQRLKDSWGGESSRRSIYDQAQESAVIFREFCLAHNLLDFSLRIELFHKSLLPLPECRRYLFEMYRHLIADNVEEDTPVAHDLVREWLKHCESALVLCDNDAGYRAFLGADPKGAHALGSHCSRRISLPDSHVTTPDLRALAYQIGRGLNRSGKYVRGDPRAALSYEAGMRFHPQMLDWVANEISHLIHVEQVAPGDIAVLAPYLGDALRFSLTEKLARYGVDVRTHRPSRALREEPATRCLLALAALAHPVWGIRPSRVDFVSMLAQAIGDMDVMRASLLARIVYRIRKGQPPTLSSFAEIEEDTKQRITYMRGGRYDDLREWLKDYVAGPQLELDHFFGKLFGEILSQPGYGFHHKYDKAEVAAVLVESARKFRWGVGRHLPEGAVSLGREYLDMVQQGVLAAQYVHSWELQPEDAVLLSPAYAFLMMNRPVEYQFWISAGSGGWWERLYQPLTHPYVLSRTWPKGRVWTDADEYEARQDALYRLTLGLVRRCSRRIFLGISDLGEQGYEQRGPLIQTVQRMLRRYSSGDTSDV